MVGRVRAWYVVVVALLVTAYYAVPHVRPVTAALVGAAGVAAVEYGIYRMRPQRQVAWHLMAVSIAILAAADVTFTYVEIASPLPVPYPVTADFISLVGYVPLTVGLLVLGRPLAPYRDETTLIDAVSITLAGSLLVWILLVRQAIDSQHLDHLGRIAAVAGWVGYIAVLAVSARVVLSWRRNTAVTLLGIAVLAFLVADFLYGHALVRGHWGSGGPVDLGYLAFTGLCGAAALSPSMRDVASPADARHALGPMRLTLICVAMLVAPTVLLAETSQGGVTTGLAIAVVSALVSVLMLLRLWMTGRAYQRRAARERAVRVASQEMVSASTPDEVVEATRAALRSVLTGDRRVEVELVRPNGGPAPPSPGAPPPPGRHHRGEITMPLAGADGAFRFTAPATEIGELRAVLLALADQAALALQRIRLAEQAGAEERERYFRTLVTTSTDVIMIIRAGRIDYATPSAHAMFGRDVTGECFDDLVRPEGPAEPEGPQWPETVEGAEARVVRPDGGASAVVVRRRDLTGDPTVRGIVTTMRDVTAERALQQDLAYRASHDELTGLANVRLWSRSMHDERERRVHRGDGTAVLFVDLDDFKSINDTYGHGAGDQVLVEVARRIRENIRAGDVAARVGGDEFAVLLRGVSSVDDARAAAARVAEALARPAYVAGATVDCRASIGLAHTERQEQVDALVGKADTALYAAKNEGKGHWREYTPGMRDPHRQTPTANSHSRGQ